MTKTIFGLVLLATIVLIAVWRRPPTKGEKPNFPPRRDEPGNVGMWHDGGDGGGGGAD